MEYKNAKAMEARGYRLQATGYRLQGAATMDATAPAYYVFRQFPPCCHERERERENMKLLWRKKEYMEKVNKGRKM